MQCNADMGASPCRRDMGPVTLTPNLILAPRARFPASPRPRLRGVSGVGFGGVLLGSVGLYHPGWSAFPAAEGGRAQLCINLFIELNQISLDIEIDQIYLPARGLGCARGGAISSFSRPAHPASKTHAHGGGIILYYVARYSSYGAMSS